MLGLKPGNAFATGFLVNVIVSPTFVSETLLIPVTINPISPGPKLSLSIGFGVKTPTLSILYLALFDIIKISSSFLIKPSITLTNITTPK